MKLMQERVLPDLGANIKCGNSLIGSEFYDSPENAALDIGTQQRINAFDWKEEFKDIMQNGGFDAVIGNPPYIRIQTLRELNPDEAIYYDTRYQSAQGKYDIYVVFVERSLELLNGNGILGLIVPNKFLIADYGRQIRNRLVTNGSIFDLVTFGQLQIFSQASIYTCLLFWSKHFRSKFNFSNFSSLDNITSNLLSLGSGNSDANYQCASLPAPEIDSEWQFTADHCSSIILGLSAKWNTLRDISDRLFQGIITGGDKLFLFKPISRGFKTTTVHSLELNMEFELENDLLYPFLRGSNIRRNMIEKPDYIILYPYKVQGESTVYYTESELRDGYPKIWSYLSKAKRILAARGSAKMKYPIWYALWNQRDMRLLETPKILVPTIADKPSFALDDNGSYFFLGSGAGGPGAYGLILKPIQESQKYVLALLNSNITRIFINATSSVFRGGYRAYSQQFLWGVPFRHIDFSNTSDRNHHNQMVSLVDQMLSLHKQLAAAKTSQDKTFIQRQIEQTDKRIDKLVYELYELTHEEIAIVEGK